MAILKLNRSIDRLIFICLEIGTVRVYSASHGRPTNAIAPNKVGHHFDAFMHLALYSSTLYSDHCSVHTNAHESLSFIVHLNISLIEMWFILFFFLEYRSIVHSLMSRRILINKWLILSQLNYNIGRVYLLLFSDFFFSWF